MAHINSSLPGVVEPAVPGTYVELSLPDQFGRDPLTQRKRSAFPPGTMAPEVALTLAAVLLAAVEQVNHDKLFEFGCLKREELTLLSLAMAFRDDDSGLTGDVFEWALMLAINSGDPVVSQLMSDALQLAQLPIERPQAVLVAAESGRLVSFSPDLPEGAMLATGRRGRPPYVANLLQKANTTTWKSDLLIGGGDRWVGASLKSNPRDLQRSLRAAADTPHPPRIGITADYYPGLVRDSETNALLVKVPVNIVAFSLTKIVLRDVQDAFKVHLRIPSAPLRQDATGVGAQLSRWQRKSVEYCVTTLLEYAGNAEHLTASGVSSTGASVSDANGALVAVNTITTTNRLPNPYPQFPTFLGPLNPRRFTPID